MVISTALIILYFGILKWVYCLKMAIFVKLFLRLGNIIFKSKTQ